MYKIKITKVESQIYDLIKAGKFFDFTYSHLAKILGLKKPQCVLNQVRALERKGMIEVTLHENRVKGKQFKEFVCYDYPKIEVIFER